MIRINQLKLPAAHTPEELTAKIARELGTDPEQIREIKIRRRGIDARRKPQVFYIYTVDVQVPKRARLHIRNKAAVQFDVKEAHYHTEVTGTEPLKTPPVIVGSGPAGLFCAYSLAKLGYQPVLLEQGDEVGKRRRKVDDFWQGGSLDPYSNVQFGEGGAGTFSDGKLNTMVKDPQRRGQFVLQTFVRCGAPEEILYDSKPHIGTDILGGVITNLREEIRRLGGEVRFNNRVTDLSTDREGRLQSLTVEDTNTGTQYELPAEAAVFAIGHSARETFSMLYEKGLSMTQKAFAVGVRVEHSRAFIDHSQYGSAAAQMGAAPYKLSAKLPDGRGVYSFCMCPGGYVVNASSEAGRLAVNGMSYHDRAAANSNSAIVVTIGPEDFGSDHPLAGVEYQRRLEERAYQVGGGRIPVQTFADFCRGEASTHDLGLTPVMKGAWAWANVRDILSPSAAGDIEAGIKMFDHKIHGFAAPEILLSGIESRTSSPVRINRDENGLSGIFGLYPCGEGAGYAGGITSAAMDGLKIAEQIAKTWYLC